MFDNEWQRLTQALQQTTRLLQTFATYLDPHDPDRATLEEALDEAAHVLTALHALEEDATPTEG